MGKIFDVLKVHQISLGEFKGEVNETVPEVRLVLKETKNKTDENKEIYEVLGIDPRILENINEIEKPIYAIGTYILESMKRFIIDSTSVQRRMSSNKFDTRGAEYKVLSNVENGITSDDELAFRYISIIYQLVSMNAKNIKIRCTSLELVAEISDPESKGNPIFIVFKYKDDGNQTLEKANKLQVFKVINSDFNK